jgi:hypothetical protein
LRRVRIRADGVILAIVAGGTPELGQLARRHHRHYAPPQGGLFALACSDGERIRGVAIVGRPVTRELAADDFAAELTRCCTDGTRNACSMHCIGEVGGGS